MPEGHRAYRDQLAVVAHIHRRNASHFEEVPAQKLAAALGRLVPSDGQPPMDFQGEPRIIVPTVRSVVSQGERLTVKLIVLANQPPKSVTLAWRPLGRGDFQHIELDHVARAVYRVELSLATETFEYCLEAETGSKVIWPSTAPFLNQTVVVW